MRVLLSPLAVSLCSLTLTAVLQVSHWSRTVASGGGVPGSGSALSQVTSHCCCFAPCLFPSLVLLVLLNMMLFYKLWMLEYTTQTLTAWQGLRLQER